MVFAALDEMMNRVSQKKKAKIMLLTIICKEETGLCWNCAKEQSCTYWKRYTKRVFRVLRENRKPVRH